jgi:hypothetical protein
MYISGIAIKSGAYFLKKVIYCMPLTFCKVTSVVMKNEALEVEPLV